MIIQESRLEKLLQCPMIDPQPSSKSDKCAMALSTWVLRQSFLNKLIGKPEKVLDNIRKTLIEIWKDENVEGDPGVIARVAGFRLFSLVLDYEVIHLEQPYNLVLTGYTIQGKYALLRKRKGEYLPYVLIVHTNSPSLKKEQALPPDVISMSRHLHASTNAGYSNVQTLHYPVLSGQKWYDKYINSKLSAIYLTNMLRVISNPSYPVPGEHCSTCVSRPCLSIFKP
jgi:hypothetical protein